MSDEAHLCPPPETLAAFVEGLLVEDEVRLLARHLQLCVDCLLTLKAVAQFEGDRKLSKLTTISHSRWWFAAAAALACTLMLSLSEAERPRYDNLATCVVEHRLSAGVMRR